MDRIIKDPVAPVKNTSGKLGKIFHIFPFMSKGKIFIPPA
jgi:hypothetical protein